MKPSATVATIVFLVILCATVGLINCEDDEITLKINDRATLVGLKEETLGPQKRTYYAFRGIPYAEPPVNENRWKEPKLLELTKPKYDATKFGPPCVQGLPGSKHVGEEDCLHLNVFTPNLEGQGEVKSKKSLLPVMVYIHCGGYIIGGSYSIGPKLFLNHDVILVTINYRLGVFGYLSTGNKNLPGNYGALDQIATLDWVQKHISKFGGDPNSVTIFGHSAGSGATHLLTMSPRSKGKYHKAITQSGSGLLPWIVNKNPKSLAIQYGNRVGCEQPVSSPEYVECLRGKSTEKLYSAQISFSDFFILPMVIQHVVDSDTRGSDAFLPELPEKLMDKGLYHSTPVLTGIVPYEGLMFYSFLHLDDPEKFKDEKIFKEEIIQKIVNTVLPFGHSEGDVPRIAQEVLRKYFPEETTDKIAAVIDIYGDSLFNSGQWAMLQKYSSHKVNTVYSYVFTHRAPKSRSTIWAQIKELRKQNVDHKLFDSAVTHIDDMFFLFHQNELLPTDTTHLTTEDDIKFAHFITGIWTAFAKNGNPAEGLRKGDNYTEWKPVGFKSPNYYNLTSIPAPMGSEFRKEESKFWTQIFHSLDEKIKRNVDEL